MALVLTILKVSSKAQVPSVHVFKKEKEKRQKQLRLGQGKKSAVDAGIRGWCYDSVFVLCVFVRIYFA